MKCLLVIGIIFLSACSSSPTPHSSSDVNSTIAQHSSSPQQRERNLEQHFHTWQGTPYRYGGLSKRGIDCSGFVYLTYLQALGTPLPRTTQAQSKVGTRVEQGKLQAGDLVFFKTAAKQRHAGIYLGQQRFMHASSSKGVTLSSLNTPYWQDSYWMARRL